MEKGRVKRKRRRNLFKKVLVPQDEKVALFRCLAGESPVDKLPVCGARFGVPFHVIRDRADELLTGFSCPKCECLYVKWENYKMFEIVVDERKGGE